LRTSATPNFNGLTLTNALPIIYGGTGGTSAAQSLTNLLPTGTVSGYVLTTSGPGTYYWAAPGTGAGIAPGTSINSTRLFPTVNAGQTIFTTPTYTPGSSQLRVYVNGVRQYNSDYTETNSNTVTLVTGTSSGDNVLIEVDGYILNPYYANNVPITVPFGSISSSANTIQLAVQDLETRKAALASPIFTGTVVSPTPSTATSNTQVSTTAFVHALANSGWTFTHSITGNAGTVTNGVYTTNLYSNPDWITSLAGSKISGSVASSNTSSDLVTTNGYQMKSVGVGTAPSATTGEIRATNNITAYYSDDRLKTRLGKIENALDKLCSLEGFYYEANETAQNLGYEVRREIGVSAQSTQSVLPEIVAPAPIDDKYLTVRYEKFAPLFIEAIKELRSEIGDIKKHLGI
jgi:hypothetical protein